MTAMKCCSFSNCTFSKFPDLLLILFLSDYFSITHTSYGRHGLFTDCSISINYIVYFESIISFFKLFIILSIYSTVKHLRTMALKNEFHYQFKCILKILCDYKNKKTKWHFQDIKMTIVRQL